MNRILQINAGSDSFNNKSINFGGVEKIIVDIYRNIDNKKYIFDFLTVGKSTYTQYYNELKSTGSNIYELKACKNRIIRLIHFFIRLILFLRSHKYKTVHIHTGALYLQTVAVIACKLSRIPNIISHSHGSKEYNSLFSKICKKIVTRFSNYKISCSKKACNSIFDLNEVNFKNIKIINNGIDVEKYIFSKDTRNRYRKQLGFKNNLVVGHVGNFYEPKNHSFLIEIFNEIQKLKINSLLVLVGDGILKEKIENKINSLGLKDKVIILGHREDIAELLSAFDVFVFPSKYEGFGLTVLEGQAAGLQCYISDTIPNEVDITDLVFRNNINSSPKLWAESILKNIGVIDRLKYNKILIDKGVGIDKTSKKIQEIYESIFEN